MKKPIGIALISLMVLAGCGEQVVQDESQKTPSPEGAAMTQPVINDGSGETVPEMVVTPTETPTPTPTTTPTTAPAPTPTPTPAPEAAPAPLVINLSSGNMFFNPNKITAKLNQKVTINFKNSGFHTFVLGAFGVNVDLKGKDTATITFIASKKGTFEFICDVPGHKAAGMVGTLVVE